MPRRKIRFPLPVESFRPDEVDDYYRMNFRLLDENGKQLESTRDLRGLLSRHGHRVQKMLEQKTASQTEKKSYIAWDFGNLVTLVPQGGP